MKRKAKRRNSIKLPIKLGNLTGFGYQVPPDFASVVIYFNQKRMPIEALPFYRFYCNSNWLTSKGSPIRNWKVLATDWIFNVRQELKLSERLMANCAFW
jgi:hypothetical protein